MKVSLLRQLREEAENNLDFSGSWRGYFFTYIFGERYEGNIVSGYCYISGNNGTFIQDSILNYIHKHYKHKKRNSTRTKEYLK